ncbi:hypothetical protein HID58_046218 [Brassica napus]|uniref:Protein kinase domain-containing protein n=2 Tax=Brassica TaxID=3705 RepID=A0ABQ8AX85_BRANA|nr:hypothetical protein HID58_046218 [Brassica napus]
MKKEAMKLERARLKLENLRKHEMEKKKKDDERKKKEAEIALKQEMEKKKKEEERKRKKIEMADRKRQREENKKLKKAKRQQVAKVERQKKQPNEKLQAEKELKRQAMKELKEEHSNAEKIREEANTRIPDDDTYASRDDDIKVISNQVKMSEESYNMSSYKCSEDESKEEDNMKNHKFVPTWARLNISISLASTLSYLHHKCEQQVEPCTQVVHRDIKTSNIMLDVNLNARLCDFGLARLTEHDKSPISTLTAVTMGYLQYGSATTEKTDAFSYGLLIPEVTCGKRAIDKESEGQKTVNLVDWVWRLHSEVRVVVKAVDERLKGQFDEEF